MLQISSVEYHRMSDARISCGLQYRSRSPDEEAMLHVERLRTAVTCLVGCVEADATAIRHRS